jgi:hypothetical protein
MHSNKDFLLGNGESDQEAENVDNSGELYSSKATFKKNKMHFLPRLSLDHMTELTCSFNLI